MMEYDYKVVYSCNSVHNSKLCMLLSSEACTILCKYYYAYLSILIFRMNNRLYIYVYTRNNLYLIVIRAYTCKSSLCTCMNSHMRYTGL